MKEFCPRFVCKVFLTQAPHKTIFFYQKGQTDNTYTHSYLCFFCWEYRNKTCVGKATILWAQGKNPHIGDDTQGQKRNMSHWRNYGVPDICVCVCDISVSKWQRVLVGFLDKDASNRTWYAVWRVLPWRYEFLELFLAAIFKFFFASFEAVIHFGHNFLCLLVLGLLVNTFEPQWCL